MALTRARAVAGEDSLRQELTEAIEEILSAPRDAEKTRADVATMRGRLIEANRAARDELWSLKHGAGGLMDIEFAAQNGLLCASLTGGESATRAFGLLESAGKISASDAATLTASHRLQSRLQQVERVALAEAFKGEAAGEGLKLVMTRVAGEESFEALEKRLGEARAEACSIVDRLLGE